MKLIFTYAPAKRRTRFAASFPAFLIAFLIFPVFFNHLHAQAPSVSWAFTTGSASQENAAAVTSDGAGNTYYTGSYNSTVDFEPGSGTTSVTSAGGTDVFILKLDQSGNLVWIKSIGGAGGDLGTDIQLDASGNLYIAGSFTGTVDFDPDAVGSTPLTSAGGTDGFIMKLDASGNFVWARNIGGTTADAVNHIVPDGSGNVYAAGVFSGTADMDPGAATNDLVSAGGNDVFVLKLDASGNFTWTAGIGGTGTEGLSSLATDASGNVYFGGAYTGTVDFDPGAGSFPITTSAGTNGFIAKLDVTGAFGWAGSVASTSTSTLTSIKTDATGNVYAIGAFGGTADLDLGAGTNNMVSAGLSDAFVTKLDGSGNPLWIIPYGAAGTDGANIMTLDATGNVYVVGTFANTVDFDPGTGTADLTGTGSNPTYLLKLDAAGNYVYASQAYTTPSTHANSDIKVDAAGNIYIVGNFAGTVTLGSTGYPSNGISDIFIAKYGAALLPLHLLGFNAWRDNGQVQLKWITAQEENVSHFAIERSSDGIQFSTIGSVNARNSQLSTDYAYTDQSPLAGTSYYRLKMIDLDGRFTSSRIQIVKSSDRGAAPQVYPVPAHDVLTISTIGMPAEAGTISLHLYNQAGQVVKSETMPSGGVHYLQVSTLVKGQYLLRLIGRNGYAGSYNVIVQ